MEKNQVWFAVDVEISYCNREGGVLQVNRYSFPKSSIAVSFESLHSSLSLVQCLACEDQILFSIVIQISVGDESCRDANWKRTWQVIPDGRNPTRTIRSAARCTQHKNEHQNTCETRPPIHRVQFPFHSSYPSSAATFT